MSVLFFDGFDFNNLPSTRWNINAPGRSTSPVRTGSHSATGNAVRDIGQNLGSVIIGCAFNKPSAGGLIRLMDGDLEQLTLRVTPGLAIEARRGNASGAVLGASANGIFPLNAWNYIEVKAVIHNSTGAIIVRLNGVPVLTLNGIDAQNTANPFVTRYALDPTSFLDDHYLADLTGSAPNNDFLGDIRVETLYPNAAGDEADFVPLVGANFQNVDDVGLPDGDASYNSSANVGDRDLYNLQNPATLSGTVHAVQTHVVARKTDSGVREIATVNKSGSTVTVGPAHTLGLSYLQYDGPIYEANPDTGIAFTLPEVQSLQAGVETIS